MSFAAIRSLASLSAAAVIVAAGLSTAFADAVPDREVSRDLVRRTLLDACVYAEAAKDGVKKEKVVDGCQCAATKALKGVKDEVIADISKTKSIPDAFYTATTEAYGTCGR